MQNKKYAILTNFELEVMYICRYTAVIALCASDSDWYSHCHSHTYRLTQALTTTDYVVDASMMQADC